MHSIRSDQISCSIHVMVESFRLSRIMTNHLQSLHVPSLVSQFK